MEKENNKEKKPKNVRRKIEINQISKRSSLYVTFSKRRQGLFNKAGECCVLCGAEIAIIAFSPGGKAFTFGHPSADAILNGYFTEYTSGEASITNLVEEGCSGSIHHDEWLYNKSAAKLEVEALKREETGKAKVDEVGEGFWWDEQCIERLDLEELNQYVESMKELRQLVAVKVDEMEKGSMSPSNFLALDSNSLFDASPSSEAAYRK